MKPSSAYNRLKKFLVVAEIPNIRFRDFRRTFATTSPEYDMDIKTLSNIIGHISSYTTLTVCTHVTDETHQTAAEN